MSDFVQMTDTIDLGILKSFFNPASVAIVGASPQRDSPRNKLLRVLLQHGFPGRVYPVSQSNPEIEGLKAYKSLKDLPEVPDIALVITPANTVPGIITECSEKGIRSAIVFSAGFEEIASGKEIAARLAQAAKAGNVKVLGPNCQGIWSVQHRSMLTYSPAAQNLATLKHAPIAVVSQSGALAGAIGGALQRYGMGCSYLISVGNETCLDSLDLLSMVIEQEDVRVVALYIEGLNRAQRLLQIAERARSRNIQIVVLKSGRSAKGQEATASHTGKIASSHAVYSDVLRQSGIISVDSLTEMLQALEALAFVMNPRVSGESEGGVSILSVSGGAGALLADHGSELNVPMADFGTVTCERLDRLLPEYARKANPVDLTGQINTVANLFRDTYQAVAEDPRTEAMVVQYTSSGRKWLKADGEVFKNSAAQLPVIVSFVAENLEPEIRSEFRAAGVLLAAEPLETMKALSWLYARQRWSVLPPARRVDNSLSVEAPKTWHEMMALCERAEITPAKWTVLNPADQAVAACKDFKYPLVVKALPTESEHKTELGLVKLRVTSPEAVDEIARQFRQKLNKPAAGILVQEMVSGGIEVVMSCLRKTDFGPVLALGSGGAAIELYRDVTHLALPVSEEEVITALRRLKLWSLLEGFRGAPPADVDALVRAAVKLGDQFLASPELDELELNPVIVGAKSQGLRAVDALMTLTNTTENNP